MTTTPIADHIERLLKRITPRIPDHERQEALVIKEQVALLEETIAAIGTIPVYTLKVHEH